MGKGTVALASAYVERSASFRVEVDVYVIFQERVKFRGESIRSADPFHWGDFNIAAGQDARRGTPRRMAGFRNRNALPGAIPAWKGKMSVRFGHPWPDWLSGLLKYPRIYWGKWRALRDSNSRPSGS